MAEDTLVPGAPAPSFTLMALGSNRRVGSDLCRGTPLMLVFHDQYAVEAVRTMQEAVRARWPDAEQLLICSVVDMSALPVILRPLAERVMKGFYAKASEAMPPGRDVADYVMILLDRDGAVSRQYGAHKVSETPLLVLIDAAGIVRGVYRGRQLAEAALQMLASLESVS
ncbi:MAG: redoxin domain-containing protein [Caldilinea sp.]|nr:redoxin domain-containing protein [Caldilinea sp.]MDW8441498.1 hypothetical protein [Caldilineaceae bacterium]